MKKLLAFSAAMAIMVVNSFATVTFDPATGLGFVGKGDVQLALGLNNAQLQAATLAFTYEESQTYDVTVEWDNETGHGIVHKQITVSRSVSVSGVVSYDARTRTQITGFFLTGFSGTPVISGTLPVVGAPFNPGEDDKVITAVTLVSSTGGGLKVNGVPLVY